MVVGVLEYVGLGRYLDNNGSTYLDQLLCMQAIELKSKMRR